MRLLLLFLHSVVLQCVSEMTSMEESMITEVLEGNHPSISRLRSVADKMSLKQAMEGVSSVNMPNDLFTLLRAESKGAAAVKALRKQSPGIIDRAFHEVLKMIKNVTDQVDSLVLYDCMPFERSRTEQIESMNEELTHLVSQQARRKGDKMAALNGVQGAQNSISSVKSSMRDMKIAWEREMSVLLKQKTEADDDASVCKILINATSPKPQDRIIASRFLSEARGRGGTRKSKELKNFYKICKDDRQHSENMDDEDEEGNDDYDDEGGQLRDWSGKSAAAMVPSVREGSLLAQKAKQIIQFKITDDALIDSFMRRNSSHLLSSDIDDNGIVFDGVRREGGRGSSGLIESGEVLGEVQPFSGNREQKCVQDRKGDMMFILHDRAGHMFGRSQDRSDRLAEEIAVGQDRHAKAVRNFVSQLNSYQNRISDLQDVVKKADADLASFEAQVKQMSSSQQSLISEQQGKRKRCRKEVHGLQIVQKCSLLKMRDNIVERFMRLDPVQDVQDCDVGPWVNQACSVPCGSGKRSIYREVMTPNNKHGADCPKIHVSMVCNTQQCPIDCQTTPFGAWSACSTKCDQGSQSRVREVTQYNRFRGKSCPNLVDERICNVKPCDVDCQLGKWEAWSSCSRSCRRGSSSGRQYRVRSVVVHRRGKGQRCAGPHNPMRLESRKCNPYPCDSLLKCAAKQDVVIAVDSSGGNRRKGFQRIQTFAKTLAQRYLLGPKLNKVGILQFSTTATVRQTLTFDASHVASGIQNLNFDGGLTFTHVAVDRAVKMLQGGGRKTAQSVLVLLTTENPARLVAASNSIKKAKQAGIRVVVNAIGSKRFLSLKSLSSFPPSDNFIRIFSQTQLRHSFMRHWYASRFMRISCPKVDPLPEALRRLECPPDCSVHGTCDTTTGKCKCDEGWMGRACNKEVATPAPS